MTAAAGGCRTPENNRLGNVVGRFPFVETAPPPQGNALRGRFGAERVSRCSDSLRHSHAAVARAELEWIRAAPAAAGGSVRTDL
jgi:hypothetical protein